MGLGDTWEVICSERAVELGGKCCLPTPVHGPSQYMEGQEHSAFCTWPKEGQTGVFWEKYIGLLSVLTKKAVSTHSLINSYASL